jgi:hypothetical protein
MMIIPAAIPTRRIPTTPKVTVLSSSPDLGSSGGGVGLAGALQQELTDGLSIHAC